MIRIADSASVPSPTPAWHGVFLQMLPAIHRQARHAFRHFASEAQEEAVQAVVCNACEATSRLAELKKLDLAFASVLARYGVAQVKTGRQTGGHLNCHDVLSPYCQRQAGIAVERLDSFDPEENQWREAVVQDTRTTPVPDVVAFRCDFRDWLRSLGRRDRALATFLAVGNRTGEAAERFEVSQGRVSQLRQELKHAWEQFGGHNHSQLASP